MHEATIAAEVLQRAGTIAAERGPYTRVSAVKVRVGDWAGVAVEALDFAFESLAPQTVCAGADFRIERIPVVGQCPGCGWQGVPEENWLVCAQCGRALRLVSGRELDLEYVELEQWSECR